MKSWLVALTTLLPEALAFCRHSQNHNGLKLTVLEIQLFVIFAILLFLLLVSTCAYLNIRNKIEAIRKERKLRLISMYQLQKFTRMQALLPAAFLCNHYEKLITPFNAEKQERSDERQVRYVLQKRNNSSH